MKKPDAMSSAALALGIGACVSICFYGSIPIGALGIIMALLSKKEKMSPPARAGLILSIVGMAIFTCIIAVIITILTVSGVWGSMLQKIETADLSDPNVVAELQEELQDELTQKLYGGSSAATDSSAAAGSSAATGSDAGTFSINMNSAEGEQKISYQPVKNQKDEGCIKINVPVSHADRVSSF